MSKNKKAESSYMEDKMKGLILAVALLLAVPALALAQNTGSQYRGEGYVFIGDSLPEYPGHLGMGHVGGGGEVNLAKGFSVGSELCAIGHHATGRDCSQLTLPIVCFLPLANRSLSPSLTPAIRGLSTTTPLSLTIF